LSFRIRANISNKENERYYRKFNLRKREVLHHALFLSAILSLTSDYWEIDETKVMQAQLTS
jgi:hypothetical protein